MTTETMLAKDIRDLYLDLDMTEAESVQFYKDLMRFDPQELLYNLQCIAESLSTEQDEMLLELAGRAKNLGMDIADFVGIEWDTKITVADLVEHEEEKPRLFVDMDGTLAVFNNNLSSEEQLYEQGYFLRLEPQTEAIEAVRGIIADQKMDVYVLSAVLTDSLYALNEKNEWVDKFLPEIDDGHRVFTPVGQEKAQYIPHGIQKGDVLLDDYSKNLHEWPEKGVAIKLMNGINGTKGTWRGPSVTLADGADAIRRGIEEIVLGSEKEVVREDITKPAKDRHNERFSQKDDKSKTVTRDV